MIALGLVVLDKKIFENCILKTYFLTPWPTYATNWNGLNNFERGPPRDHSCEVWSKSNKRFQRRCSLQEIVDGRTDGRTDDGRQTLKDHKSSLSTSCSGELKISQVKILVPVEKKPPVVYIIKNMCSCIFLCEHSYLHCLTILFCHYTIEWLLRFKSRLNTWLVFNLNKSRSEPGNAPRIGIGHREVVCQR